MFDQGKDGVDTMQIQIGSSGCAPNFRREVTTATPAGTRIRGHPWGVISRAGVDRATGCAYARSAERELCALQC